MASLVWLLGLGHAESHGDKELDGGGCNGCK